MINTTDILETVRMIREENLDIRTVTMGISLFDCISDDPHRLEEKIYDKITSKAKDLGFLKPPFFGWLSYLIFQAFF